MNNEIPLHKYTSTAIFIRNKMPYSYYLINSGGEFYIDRVGERGLITCESYVRIERIRGYISSKNINSIEDAAMIIEFGAFQQEYIRAYCMCRKYLKQ